MLFSNLLSLAAAFLSVSAATSDSEEAKHGKPCGGCGSREEAERVVNETFDRLVATVRLCDYEKALTFSTPDATFSTVDASCSPCCYGNGDIKTWWTFYTCESQVVYPEESRKIQHLKNGTVVLSAFEALSFSTNNKSLYTFNYYFFPVQGKCEYLIGYIDGNTLECPAFVPNALSCEECAAKKTRSF